MQQEKGYLVSLVGVVLTLLWIGVFKFTPTEAEAIRPLVESHPLMNWMFSIFSVQSVSNLIGITEIIVAIGMVVGIWKPKVGYWSGLAAIVIFITTLSFLFTLSGVWKIVDGVPVTEFFIFKDVVFLGVAWLSVERSRHLIQASKP
ncbi:protein of unknown function DUF417 [Shewanella halifaxensis HAW-EB4]|uniref:DUF417 family protein n=1 Tax=Shewanella halifaxensis (strain HAW-EB4) TaxID=458817 RepID=B0TKQ5_SHEHH|nr:DUF417 family protein [Shewanella halifaxensis]ABZ75857.1 protein of unknown function DUF417 [Shewanella halifaxensis HAW-EB4]